MATLFAAVTTGEPLPGCPQRWASARSADGATLLHVAAQHGRYDTMWRLVKACPELAAVPDNQLRLPEDVACSTLGVGFCRRARIWTFVDHTVL